MEVTESTVRSNILENNKLSVLYFVFPGESDSDLIDLYMKALERKYGRFIKFWRYNTKTAGRGGVRHFKVKQVPYVIFINGKDQVDWVKKGITYWDYERKCRSLIRNFNFSGGNSGDNSLHSGASL